MSNESEVVSVVDHRRHPDPVEWALLVDKVTRIGVALDELKLEFREAQGSKCKNCHISEQMIVALDTIKDTLTDHERRMRKLEEFFYKGMAVAALGAPMFYFILHKLWP